MKVIDLANTLGDEIQKSEEYVDFKLIREEPLNMEEMIWI